MRALLVKAFLLVFVSWSFVAHECTTNAVAMSVSHGTSATCFFASVCLLWLRVQSLVCWQAVWQFTVKSE